MVEPQFFQMGKKNKRKLKKERREKLEKEEDEKEKDSEAESKEDSGVNSEDSDNSDLETNPESSDEETPSWNDRMKESDPIPTPMETLSNEMTTKSTKVETKSPKSNIKSTKLRTERPTLTTKSPKITTPAAVDVDSAPVAKQKSKSSFFTSGDDEDQEDGDSSGDERTTSNTLADDFKGFTSDLKSNESIKDFLKSRTAEGKKTLESVFMGSLSDKKAVGGHQKKTKNRAGQRERQRSVSLCFIFQFCQTGMLFWSFCFPPFFYVSLFIFLFSIIYLF